MIHLFFSGVPSFPRLFHHKAPFFCDHLFIYPEFFESFFMVVHQGFNSFSKCSSRFFSEEFNHSSSCIPKCNSLYLIFRDGVISFLTISIHVSRFTCCQEWGILNLLISSLELSCVIFHLKPSLRNVAIMVLINDPSFLLSSRREKISSLRWSQASNCFR